MIPLPITRNRYRQMPSCKTQFCLYASKSSKTENSNESNYNPATNISE